MNNDGENIFNSSKLYCAFYDYDKLNTCIHSGEMRVVDVENYNNCDNLVATDTLGAFNWYCDASTVPVRMISTGLKKDKNLSDLLDFTISSWLNNSVTVMDGDSVVLHTPSSQWWDNSIIEINNGGSLSEYGAVYIVNASPSEEEPVMYSIENDSIALVIKPDVVVSEQTERQQDIITASDMSFLWIEGANMIKGLGGISLTDVKASVIRNVGITNSSRALYLRNSNGNKISNIKVSGIANALIHLNSSNSNELSNIVVANNDKGLYLKRSNNNVFENPYRGWSIDSEFLSSENRGSWLDGIGRIIDWSLLSTDTEIRASNQKYLSGDIANTISHVWDGIPVTYLRNAVEIHNDGVGNDNNYCESNEICLYTPNAGRYQGHGSLQSAGMFVNGDGTISNVTLMEFSINGF